MNKKNHPSAELTKAITHLTSLQTEQGYVAGEVVWCCMITAQYIITAYITQQEIPPDRKRQFQHYFLTRQGKEGGWGIHSESPPFVFTTTLAYIALRLLDIPAEHVSCLRALNWIHKHGGVLQIPTWGKFLLALLNLYQWDGVNPVLPEMWLLPEEFPLHPKLMYRHTRMIYLAMSYLYGIKFQAPETDLIKQLRLELYTDPYETLHFKHYRNAIAATDIYIQPAFILKMIYQCLTIYDKYHSKNKRQKALNKILDHVIYHQRQTKYVAINPLNGLFNTLILYHTQHEDFLASYQGIDYWLWQDDTEGLRMMGATSETWDTAFAIQAICEIPTKNAEHFLHNANDYFKQAIMDQELPDHQKYYQDPAYGGFCFGKKTQCLPVTDCTAETLSALCLLRQSLPPQNQFSATQILAIIHFITSRQNKDGGWSCYDQLRGGSLLELFNPTEMFGDCMVDHSYVACSASCLHGLRQALIYYPELHNTVEYRAINDVMAKGAVYIRSKQQRDGSWPGVWAINFIYGTLFGVTGLLASGASPGDPAIVRACQWIVSKQLADGGWGESWQGCRECHYIPHTHSQVIMTSWALITLLKANYQGTDADAAISRGIALLKYRQLDNGDWPRESVAGVFFGTGMLDYCLYKNYFPIWAIALYEKQ